MGNAGCKDNREHASFPGRYHIEKELGRGGLCTVYLARDLRLNKAWAVKQFPGKPGDPWDEMRWNCLHAEAALMKKLDHPALPRIVDIFEEESFCAVVMDYIPGVSLAEVIRRDGAVPEAKALNWMRQLADVLEYLHAQDPPILYLDMKPENVMLRPDGRLALLDLGAALELRPGDSSGRGEFGTPAYAAPEQMRGERVDARADLYALGMTILEALTGIPPESGAGIRGQKRWLGGGKIGAQAREILEGCLAAQPDRRFRSCEELLRTLDMRAGQPEKSRAAQKKAPRLTLLLLIALIELSVLLGGGRWSARADPGQAEQTALAAAESALAEGKRQLFREGEESFRRRVLTAAPFFHEALDLLASGAAYENPDKTESALREETDPERKRLLGQAECYARLCDFYSRYMFTENGVQQPGGSDYRELLHAVETCLEDTASPDTEDGAHVRLLLLDNLISLLREYRQGFALSGIAKERLIAVTGRIEEEVRCVEAVRTTLTAQKDKLLLDCADCMERIEDSYDSVLRWRKAEGQ